MVTALAVKSYRLALLGYPAGSYNTPMVQNILRKAAKDGLDRMALAPFKRISTVEDQAAAAAFLCSPEGGITGIAPSVDAGRAIR